MNKNTFAVACPLLLTVVLGLAWAIADKQQTKAAPLPPVTEKLDLRLGLKRLAPMQVAKQFPGECDNPAVQIIPDKDYVVVHCTFANFGFGPAGNGYYFAWRMR